MQLFAKGSDGLQPKQKRMGLLGGRDGCDARQGRGTARRKARSAECRFYLRSTRLEKTTERKAVGRHGTVVGGRGAEAIEGKL